MKIKQAKIGKASASYEVVVPVKIISDKVKVNLSKVAKDADIPGFRKGKAPHAILEQRYGDKAFGEAVNEVIQTAMEKIVKDDDLRVGMQPSVEISSADKDKDLAFSISFVLLPVIKYMDFSKIKLETIKAKVAEKDIKEAIDKIAKDSRETAMVDRQAKIGDTAMINFLGKVDGVPFEGGAGNDFSLELGSGSFIPGFEEQLVGCKAGDKKDVDVTFPAEYHAENLSSKQAVFECEVLEVKQFVESKIDDEFAKNLGMEDLKALKANVVERLGGQFDQQTRQLVKSSLMDQLVAGHSFDIADEMINLEFDDLWKQVQSAKSAGQLDPEDTGKSEKELEKEYRILSERRVKLGVLLSELSNEFKIEVSQDDVQKAIMAEAQRYPGQEMQVFEYYQKNPEVMEQLKAPLLEEKVVDALIKKANVSVKEMDSDAIVKLLEGDKPTAKATFVKKVTVKKA